MPAHSVARWVRRKFGVWRIERPLADGSAGVSIPCVLCRRVMDALAVRWEATGPAGSIVRADDDPPSAPTRRQRNMWAEAKGRPGALLCDIRKRVVSVLFRPPVIGCVVVSVMGCPLSRAVRLSTQRGKKNEKRQSSLEAPVAAHSQQTRQAPARSVFRSTQRRSCPSRDCPPHSHSPRQQQWPMLSRRTL